MTPLRIRAVILFAALWMPGMGGCAALSKPKAPDRIFFNGRIITLDPVRPVVEALALREGRITAVGTDRELLETAGGATERIDLEHAVVFPGFTDAHLHLLGIGTARRHVDLKDTRSAAEVVARVRARAVEQPEGSWVLGRGWDQNDWPVKRFPRSAGLSEGVLNRHPVFLTRIDGHAGWANEAAMAAAGVTRETPDPPGGRIMRDERGNPTGVFIDSAMELVRRRIPPPGPEEVKAALAEAVAHCASLGLTEVHDAGVGGEVLGALRELAEEGRLPIRVYAMLSGDDEALLEKYYGEGPVIESQGGLLTIRAVKFYADGALGSRGAALLEPYSDEPGNRGLLMLDAETLRKRTEEALRHGYQVCTHAIGDRANRMVLDAYSEALAACPEARDARLRVEHAQILDRRDIPRFAERGIIPSMQPTHCTSDAPWACERLGEERVEEGAYAWRSLLDTGVVIPGGSDAPVESVNPLWGIYAAVTRMDPDGVPAGGWYPAQRMTRVEALKSFTLWPAYAAFEEGRRGSVEVGKAADLTVLDRDVLAVPPREILDAHVLMTVVGGRIVYRAEGGR